MKLNFVKMQCAGNDYIFIPRDINEKIPASLIDNIPFISNRNFGIGGDGVVFILIDARCNEVRMKMYNSDGSAGKMCGNASRCIAKYCFDNKIIKINQKFNLITDAGIKNLFVLSSSSKKADVKLELGPPDFLINGEEFILKERMFKDKKFKISCVNVGNLHCVIFVDKITDCLILNYGPIIQNSCFPDEKVNVEFAEIINENHVNIRVWETGSGETLSCGTGAAAVFAAGQKTGKLSSSIESNMPGGKFKMEVDKKGSIFQTGKAVEVFNGFFSI
ncbi:MAG: diaminopimelate epimerase [Candidatus Muiribacteriota bacterium]